MKLHKMKPLYLNVVLLLKTKVKLQTHTNKLLN